MALFPFLNECDDVIGRRGTDLNFNTGAIKGALGAVFQRHDLIILNRQASISIYGDNGDRLGHSLIEIWFSVLQRKPLTPNHFNSVTELVQSIMEFIRRENLSPNSERSYEILY